jgi:radical SAM protein with 4Fe4S-binding SPASM domain
MYRLVINHGKAAHQIVPIGSGKSATITTAAANLLANLQPGNERELHFLRFASDLGWVTNNTFNGTIRKIATAHHLKRVQIELLTRCNLQCSYCYSESGPENHKSLPFSVVESLIREANELGVVYMDFTGGEFFLYPQWRAVLQLARDLGLIISVHTNGTALTEANVENLVACHVNCVQVSVDGHHAELHDSVRGLKGSFDKTIRGIRECVKAGLKVSVTQMVHRQNVAFVAEAYSTLRELVGPKPRVKFDRLATTGGELQAGLALTPKQFFEALAPHLGSDRKVGKLCSPTGDLADLEPHCGVGANYVYITSDGEIALCPTMTSRDAAEFAGPNVKDVSLREAWNNGAIFNRYRGVNCQNVKVCPSGSQCRGGCRSNAYFDSGDATLPDVVSCNFNKNESTTFVNYLDLYPNLDKRKMKTRPAVMWMAPRSR